MLGLAKLLAPLPFTVNVFGKKRDLIVKIGDLIYSEKRLEKIELSNKILDLSKSEYFKIMAYASVNFLNDFRNSDLGHFMFHNLKNRSTFIDIGANLGGYSFMATELGAEVYLFEPVPELSSVLTKNSSAFGRVFNVALSDEKGELAFHTSSKNIGGSSLVDVEDRAKSGYDGQISVQVDRFDSVFQKEISEGKTFDLVKIDVEGNEYKTVCGMEKALEKNLIKSLWSEVRGMSSDRNAGSYMKVCEYLENYNMKSYLYHNGIKKPFDYKNASDCPQFFDLLFLKNE